MSDKTIKLAIVGDGPPDPVPTAIQIWWDRNERMWATRLVDAEGNEIGETDWDFTKQGRDISIASLKRGYPNLPLQKLRPGSL